jgi:biotin carboxyl carrier protein
VRTYQIRVDDQDYTVEIDDPNASPAIVQVNGIAFEVTIVGQTADVQPAQPVQPRRAVIDLDEGYVPTVATTFVETTPEVTPEPAQSEAKPPIEAEGAVEVVAPMPGKVMDVGVQVGDQVKQGDTLCNLEAMKMKSPIRTTSDGTVTQVLIREGQNVNYGDVLFTLS